MNDYGICVICGEPFPFKFKREWRPHIYCTDKCRIIAANERQVKYQRDKRTKRYKVISQIHNQAHYESFNEGLNIDPQELYSPRIDLNHDTWDMIPGLEYDNVGTITDRDLDIIETEDGPRIKAKVDLEKRGMKK